MYCAYQETKRDDENDTEGERDSRELDISEMTDEDDGYGLNQVLKKRSAGHRSTLNPKP